MVRGRASGHRVGVAPGAVGVVLAVRAHAEQHRNALTFHEALHLRAHLYHHPHGVAARDERHLARAPVAAQLLHVAAAEAAEDFVISAAPAMAVVPSTPYLLDLVGGIFDQLTAARR